MRGGARLPLGHSAGNDIMPERLVKQHRHYWEDADHLLTLAKAYEAKIQPTETDQHNRYHEYWKFRMARMSFIARMLAVEALLNNALEAYGLDEKYADLTQMARSFPRREKFPRISRKRRGQPFQVPLKWKLYLIPYICRAESRMVRDEYFQYDDGIYQKFKQLIVIRNEFVHARFLTDRTDGPLEEYLRAGHPKPISEMVFDHTSAKAMAFLGTNDGPICLQLADAEICRAIMYDTIKQLHEFLDGRILAPVFWDSDEIVLE